MVRRNGAEARSVGRVFGSGRDGRRNIHIPLQWSCLRRRRRLRVVRRKLRKARAVRQRAASGGGTLGDGPLLQERRQARAPSERAGAEAGDATAAGRAAGCQGERSEPARSAAGRVFGVDRKIFRARHAKEMRLSDGLPRRSLDHQVQCGHCGGRQAGLLDCVGVDSRRMARASEPNSFIHS